MKLTKMALVIVNEHFIALNLHKI